MFLNTTEVNYDFNFEILFHFYAGKHDKTHIFDGRVDIYTFQTVTWARQLLRTTLISFGDEPIWYLLASLLCFGVICSLTATLLVG
jgi:hypothetical protein